MSSSISLSFIQLIIKSDLYPQRHLTNDILKGQNILLLYFHLIKFYAFSSILHFQLIFVEVSVLFTSGIKWTEKLKGYFRDGSL